MASKGKVLFMSDKPNILIIWGDDIGQSNISCYSDGVMGYQTPNIDRIAAEGVRFTDYYGEQSCTAGRAAFITGQNPYRTGLTKVGMPGAEIGLKAEDPTIATALKAQGYATGQFGKNHLGDRDEHLPDHARLRRVLRQPVSPQRRRGTRTARLSRRTRSSGRSLGHGESCTPGPMPTEPSASRTPVRSPRSGWRPATANSATPQSTSSNVSTRHRPRSSSGSTPRTCTSAPIPSPKASAGPDAGSPSTTTR